MKNAIKGLVGLAVVVALAGAGIMFGPKVVYGLPIFQSWVKTQINKQSGGSFDFASIRGDLSAAQLTGAALRFENPGQSNLVAVEMTDLTAGFEIFPLATLRLQLTELTSQGGRVHLKLAGGDVTQIRFPVNAKAFRIEDGVLRVENIHGYTFELKGLTLTARPEGEGMAGSFQGAVATIGQLKLEAVSGQYTFSAGQLSVRDFIAKLPGKTDLVLSGNLSLNQNQPLEGLKLDVKSGDVAGLLRALGYSSAFGGEAHVTCEANGYHRPELKNLKGKGTYAVNGIGAQVGLPSFPGFDQAGILKMLKRIEGLKGEGTYVLEGDRIRIDGFHVRNPNMDIAGAVDVGLDKRLKGDMTFKAHPDLEGEFPAVVRGIFERDANRWIVIPFTFAGTTDQPRVETGSMITKALANPANVIKGVGDAGEGAVNAVEGIGKGIMSIFGGGKKEE